MLWHTCAAMEFNGYFHYTSTRIQCHASAILKPMKSNLIIQLSFIGDDIKVLAQAHTLHISSNSNAIPMSYPLWSKLHFIAFQCQDSRAHNGCSVCVFSPFSLFAHRLSARTFTALNYIFMNINLATKTGENAAKIGYACSIIIYGNGFRWSISIPI